MNLDRIIAVRNDKTIYHDGDRCVKSFNENYKKHDIMNEARNHALLEESGLNVPEFIGVEKINGKWSIVSEFISGKTLTELMEENPGKRAEYMELFVDLQLSVHKKRGTLLNRQDDQFKRRIDSSDLPATVRYSLATVIDDIPNRTYQICHGDFTPSNIIVKEDGTPYIIDWSHAALGNVKADMALSYLLFWMRGKIDLAAMYLKILGEKAGIEEEEVLFWMPVVAASLYAKCSNEEREFLLSWINDIHHN